MAEEPARRVTIGTVQRVLLLVAAILAIAAPGSAWVHGDPVSHYLETDAL